jgi:predicted transcriptional regulator with HTH domain
MAERWGGNSMLGSAETWKTMLCVIILNFLSHISHAVFLSKSERKLISVWLMGLLVYKYCEAALIKLGLLLCRRKNEVISILKLAGSYGIT